MRDELVCQGVWFNRGDAIFICIIDFKDPSERSSFTVTIDLLEILLQSLLGGYLMEQSTLTGDCAANRRMVKSKEVTAIGSFFPKKEDRPVARWCIVESYCYANAFAKRKEKCVSSEISKAHPKELRHSIAGKNPMQIINKKRDLQEKMRKCCF